MRKIPRLTTQEETKTTSQKDGHEVGYVDGNHSTPDTVEVFIGVQEPNITPYRVGTANIKQYDWTTTLYSAQIARMSYSSRTVS
jgi:hypothetical protein